MTHKVAIDQVVNIICPPSDLQYSLSHSKYNLLEYCKKLSFNTPESTLISQVEDLDNLKGIIKFPIIAKPASTAVLVDNHILNFTVKKIATFDKLVDFVREHVNNTPIILQEIITGNGAGVNFLAKDGKIIELYIHLREREAYGGGVSSLRRVLGGDHLNLFHLISDFVQSTNWSGLGMMEFKIQGTTPYLMELNARPWGSIEAGVIAGHNIPAEFIQTFLEKKNIEYQFRKGNDILVINSKWDLQFSMSDMQREKTIAPFFRWMYSAFFNFKIKVEDSIISDFKFNLYNHLFIFINAIKKRLKKRVLPHSISIVTPDDLKSKSKIGFVCFGNICRSPFAEEYAKSRYENKIFSSYGLFTQPNRMPPMNAVYTAKSLGVDIENHRSIVLTEAICEEVDVLLFMDDIMYAQACELFGKYRSKMYKIGEYDIPDPYDTDLLNFKHTYAVISNRITELFGM